MLEITNKVKKDNIKIEKSNKKIRNFIQKVESYDSKNIDILVQEIKDKGIEAQTIIVSSSSRNHGDNIRQFNIECLSLNDIYILNDVFSIFTQYKYLIFDNLQIDSQDLENVRNNIISLSTKHVEVIFLWLNKKELIKK